MTPEAIAATCKALVGQVIESMEWSPADANGPGYWVMKFTDGSEICFNRMMAEICDDATQVTP